jgi:hypothetical protein
MHFRDSLIHLLKSQLLQPPMMVAEVGVHRARTSVRLLTEFPRMHLYCVDLWRAYPTQSSDTLSRETQEQHDLWFTESMSLLRTFGDRAEVLRMDSVAAVPEMQPLDAAFLDASHEYEGCKRDLVAYWNQVRPTGILCGHDFRKTDLPGVTQAVLEFAHERGLDLHEADGNLWWFRKVGK